MITKRVAALLAWMALLFVHAPGMPSERGHGKPVVRENTLGEHRGFRTTGRRGTLDTQRGLLNPGVWWVPTAPPAPVPGPSVVNIKVLREAVAADPARLTAEPPYYWYACGRLHGGRPSPRAPAAGYCVGGLTPSHPGRPGPGKTIEQFQADTAACQEWASANAATLPWTSESMQARYDTAFQQCLQAAGNEAPGDGVRDQAENHQPSPSKR